MSIPRFCTSIRFAGSNSCFDHYPYTKAAVWEKASRHAMSLRPFVAAEHRRSADLPKLHRPVFDQPHSGGLRYGLRRPILALDQSANLALRACAANNRLAMTLATRMRRDDR